MEPRSNFGPQYFEIMKGNHAPISVRSILKYEMACMQGSFPGPKGPVSCAHCAHPTSLGIYPDRCGKPLREAGPPGALNIYDGGRHPLDACIAFSGREVFRQVALVHVVPLGQNRMEPVFAHHREAEIFVRTPYLQAMQVHFF